MFPLPFPPDFKEYNRCLTREDSRLDPDQSFRDQMVRPDPVYMAIRRCVTAMLGRFTRSQDMPPVSTANRQIQPITSTVALAADEDTPRMAA